MVYTVHFHTAMKTLKSSKSIMVSSSRVFSSNADFKGTAVELFDHLVQSTIARKFFWGHALLDVTWLHGNSANWNWDPCSVVMVSGVPKWKMHHSCDNGIGDDISELSFYFGFWGKLTISRKRWNSTMLPGFLYSWVVAIRFGGGFFPSLVMMSPR